MQAISRHAESRAAAGLLDAASARYCVSEKLRKMAALQTRIEKLQAALEEGLEALHRRHDRRIADLNTRAAGMLAELEAFCQAQRPAVLPEGRKSLTTPSGDVGFRRTEGALALRDGVTDAEACRLLREAGFAPFVRTREAPDKRGLRRALAEGALARPALEECGLALLEGGERFYCTVRNGSRVTASRGGGAR